MMNLTQTLHSSVSIRPRSIATSCNGVERNWIEFRDRVARLAGALTAQGLERGDRVAVLALNSDRYLECYFACWWAGLAVVPMNTRWSEAEFRYSLEDSASRILMVDNHFIEPAIRLVGELESLDVVVHMEAADHAPGVQSYERLLTAADPMDDVGAGGEELAGIYYTGGTTGFPKGVMLPHRAIWYNAIVAGHHLGLEDDTRYLHVGPMFHLADHAASFGTAMAGGSHYFLPAFEPRATIDAIEQHAITHSLMVPTMIGMLLTHESFAPERLGSLKAILYGGSPMPEGVMRRALDVLPSTGFVQGYGQTELAPLATCMAARYHTTDGPHAGKLQSAGQPVWGAEIRLLDDAGNEVPLGKVGEVVVRSPGTMLGYWNRPEETAGALKEGWIHTGDAAYQDEDGFFFIVDRIKDMIVTGGENVFCVEVESAVSTHPDVAAVAVIGIPDAQWGEAVHAIVIPRPGADPDAEEIMAHTRKTLAGFKCPRSISFRSEPFPLSGAGKVLKRELREPYWKGSDRRVG